MVQDVRCSHHLRGWYWGSQAFAEKMLRLAQGAPAQQGKGLPVSGGQQVGVGRSGGCGSGCHSSGRVKGGADPRRAALARLLLGHTTASQGWIAQRLKIGSAANVSQLLRHGARAGNIPELPRAFANQLTPVK